MLSRSRDAELYWTLREVFGHTFVRHSQCEGLHPETTHLIIESGFVLDRRSEKLLEALAAGNVWILEVKYILKSMQAGHLLPEGHFDVGNRPDLNRSAFYLQPRRDRFSLSSSGGIFQGWKLVVLITDLDLRRRYSKVLQRGGAQVHAWTLQHLVDTARTCSQYLSMILADPSLILDTKFQTFLELIGDSLPVVSYVFIDEYLTSVTRPSLEAFDALSEDVIHLHLEEKALTKELPVHDFQACGSPNLGIRPFFVQEKLQLGSRLEPLTQAKTPHIPIEEPICQAETSDIAIEESICQTENDADDDRRAILESPTELLKIKRLKEMALKFRGSKSHLRAARVVVPSSEVLKDLTEWLVAWKPKQPNDSLNPENIKDSQPKIEHHESWSSQVEHVHPDLISIKPGEAIHPPTQVLDAPDGDDELQVLSHSKMEPMVEKDMERLLAKVMKTQPDLRTFKSE